MFSTHLLMLCTYLCNLLITFIYLFFLTKDGFLPSSRNPFVYRVSFCNIMFLWWRLWLKMAAERGGSRYLLYLLLFSTGVLVYFYWNASSSGTAMFVEMERLTQQWTTANRTVGVLRYYLDNCRAQVLLLLEVKVQTSLRWRLLHLRLGVRGKPWVGFIVT